MNFWERLLIQYKRLTDAKFSAKYEAQHRKSFFRYRRRLWSYRFKLIAHLTIRFVKQLPVIGWILEFNPELFSLSTKDLADRWGKIFAALYLIVGAIYAALKRFGHYLLKWLSNLVNRFAEKFSFDFRIDTSRFGILNYELPEFPSFRSGRTVSAQSIFNSVLGHENAVVTSKWSKDREVTLSDGTVQRRAHKGTDLRTRGNIPVYSPFSGTVTSVHNSLDGDGGRYIIVTSGNLCMFVCHLSKIEVKVGDTVRQGQRIAISGRSGKGQENFYDPHLHVDFRKKINGIWVSVDPETLSSEHPSTFTSRIDFPQANVPILPLSRTATHDADVVNVVQFFINRGYTLNQAAAILGNLEQESNLNPSALNPKSGASGICQWLGARKETYRKTYGKFPHLDADLTHQVEFLYSELNQTWQHNLLVNKKFYASDDLNTLVSAFCFGFERPGASESHIEKRCAYALQDKNIYLSGAKTKVINTQSDFNHFNLHP